jgi:DNA-directed RNA polymerase specialized sigma24 family protein
MVAWPKKVGGLPADEQRAYLIKIVINEARQILRRSYRSREFPGVDAGERASPSPSIEEKVQAKEELRLVWQAISELPGARRDVVTLRAIWSASRAPRRGTCDQPASSPSGRSGRWS